MSANPDNWPVYNFPDQLARMPLVAQKRFKKFAADLEDVTALLSNHMERERAAGDRVADVKRRVDMAARGGGAPDEQLAAERAQADADLDELFALRGKLNAVHAYLSRTVSHLKDNVVPAIHAGVVAVNVTAVPKEGESLRDAIARTRGEINDMKGRLAATREAPRPRGELLAAARTAVNDLAFAGEPAVITAGGKFVVKWDRLSVPGHPSSDGATAAARLLAALDPDRLYEVLAKQIPDVPGLSAAERADRIRELEVRIMQLEHREEALIAQALAQGLDVLRRADASPFALLSVSPAEMAQPLLQAAE